MLVNCTTRNTGPIPAYGTTRYSGVINFEGNGNKYFINSPRNAYIGLSPPCTKTDKWSKKSVNNNHLFQVLFEMLFNKRAQPNKHGKSVFKLN